MLVKGKVCFLGSSLRVMVFFHWTFTLQEYPTLRTSLFPFLFSFFYVAQTYTIMYSYVFSFHYYLYKIPYNTKLRDSIELHLLFYLNFILILPGRIE